MMKKMLGLRTLWKFRSFIRSTSNKSFADLKIIAEKLTMEQCPVKLDVETLHTRGASEQIDLLEGKLQQAVNEHAKFKVKQAETSKFWQGLCSNVSSARRLCDQLTALQQLASHTKQAEEGKKFFEAMLGKNSKALYALNCLLDDLRELENAELKIVSEGETKKAVNENAKLKLKQTQDSKLWLGLYSKISSTNTLCDQLIETLLQAKKHKKFFEVVIGQHSKALDEFKFLLHTLSTKLEYDEQNIISDDLEEASVKTYIGMVEAGVQPENTLRAEETRWAEETRRIRYALVNPMISGTLRSQISYMLKPNCLYRRSFHQTALLDFGKKRKDLIFPNQKFPGNTARIVLNPDDLIASKHSYLKGIRKVQSWCKSKSRTIDLSNYFGPGAEVYTTPEEGTFHLTFEYKGREITFFISGRDLYIRGWEVDKVKLFEIREKNDTTEHFIQESRRIAIEMGVNYCDICKDGNVGSVRLGFKALTDSFEELHKSSSLSDVVMRAIAVFAVHGPEAVRFEWVLEDVLEAFDSSAELDSKRTLSLYVKKYSHYSCEYLNYVHQLTNGLPVPKITNRCGGNIRDIYELRSLLSIPLRTALKKTSKKAKKEEHKAPIWSPPYPDGKEWLLMEEEQEQMEKQLLKKKEQAQLEEQLFKEEQQEQIVEQEEIQVEDQQKMQDHSIGGSIVRCMSFANAEAPGVRTNILPSGYRSWPRIAKFLRWFIR